ncbi:MAG: hypothetical protein ACRDK0_09810, partial [Solirubrobacteraceae bacterium]
YRAAMTGRRRDRRAAAAAGRRGRGALVRGEVRFRTGRPRLFKGTGMAWQDLVIASAVHARA